MKKNIYNERAHEIFFKILQVDRVHRNLFEKMHSALGIHRSQHKILMFISSFNGKPSQKDLAEHFQVSAAAIAVSIKKLENGGYIERETLEDDNRFNSITLTEKGKKVASQSADFIAQCDKAMFENFNDSDFESLARCIEMMDEGLTKYSAEIENSLKKK